MEIIQAYFTNHPCMGRKKREIHPVGILVHSTGAVNRELRRYVDEPERLGRNLYNNHWNKANATKSVHAFIGYDKDKQVIVAETLPHDVACWGVGSGKKGSYNYDPHAYLQFEICQGSTSDAAYYWEAIKVAEEYCAHLCRIYGWTADNITSHAEAHRAGYASNHGDPASWMKAFGDDMDKFRMRVRALLDAPVDDVPPDVGTGDKPEADMPEPVVDASGAGCQTAAALSHVVNEALNILENCALMELPLSAFLRKLLEVLKEKNDQRGEDRE